MLIQEKWTAESCDNGKSGTLSEIPKFCCSEFYLRDSNFEVQQFRVKYNFGVKIQWFGHRFHWIFCCSGWITVKKNRYLDLDLRTTSLRIFTNTSGRMYLDMQNAHTIDIDIRNEQYQIYSCNYGGWTKFNNLPADVNKKWTFTKTKEALTILCNGVELVNLVYAEQHNYCTTRWSKDVTRIRCYNHDTASVLWKSVTQGSISIEHYE